MNNRFALVCLAIFGVWAVSFLFACSALSTPGNATTQAIGEVGNTAGAIAPVVAVTAPLPWGPIAGGALALVSVIAGVVVNIASHRVTAATSIAAVTAGTTAASMALAQQSSLNAAGAIAAANAGAAAANQVIESSPSKT